MISLTINLTAASMYFLASLYLGTNILHKRPVNTKPLLLLTLCAMGLHAAGIQGIVLSENGYQSGIFKVLAPIFLVVNLLVLLSSMKKPLHNLFIFLFPLSAMAILLGIFSASPVIPYTELTPRIALHIFLSLLAYSLLTIATLQALLLSYQNYQLKHKHPMGTIRLLPPLQTMEALLFELLWAGVVILTLSIITGFLFFDDLFSQRLVHKTAFSLLAWAIYVILLAGHQLKGWRGGQATKWTLGGFSALVLAYFGTKFVLEIVLKVY